MASYVDARLDADASRLKNWSSADNNVDEQLARKLREDRAAVEFAKKLETAKSFGDDVFVNGTVLKFDKLFASSGIVYSFAAIKAGKKWYLTGRLNGFVGGGSWEDLVLALVSGDYPVGPESVVMMREGEVILPEIV